MSKNDIARQVSEATETARAKQKYAGQSSKAQRKKANRGFPFKVDETGVYRRIERESDDGAKRQVWQRWGSELRVLALTRNGENEDWGRLLEVVDRDGDRHLWAMPAALLAGSGDALRAELFRLGFELEPRREAKAWLLEYLMKSEPDQRAKCVSRIGWHDGTYVLPDGPIGPIEGSEIVILQSAEKPDHSFNVAGTLEKWQAELAIPALGNSRLVFGISVAFAAALLALVGEEGGGFHFRGASSSGKSTSLTVAGSVWGGGGTQGFVRNWRATDNALESVAALSNDNLLCLDEISQVDAKAAGAAVYMLANGRGKARAGREGQARKVLEWTVYFLSNGEIGLGDKIREGGGRIAAGMEVRVIDLRADAGAGMGIFEDIHGASVPANFAQSLKKSASTHYGTAGRAFVAEVAKDLAEYRDRLAELRQKFMENNLPPGADGQVRRVMNRFAFVAAAGEIATIIGLTGWPAGTALAAAQRCVQDWLAERGGIGSSEVAEAKRRIIEAIDAHGKSRFQPFDKGATDRAIVTDRYGFVKFDRDSDGEEKNATYLFTSTAFKTILSGFDRKTIVSELLTKGVIVGRVKPDGTVDPCPGQRVPSDHGKNNRLYQIDWDKLTASTPGPVDDTEA